MSPFRLSRPVRGASGVTFRLPKNVRCAGIPSGLRLSVGAKYGHHAVRDGTNASSRSETATLSISASLAHTEEDRSAKRVLVYIITHILSRSVFGPVVDCRAESGTHRPSIGLKRLNGGRQHCWAGSPRRVPINQQWYAKRTLYDPWTCAAGYTIVVAARLQ
jgi:hypothetical protein